MSSLDGSGCSNESGVTGVSGPWQGAASAAGLPCVAERPVCLLGFENGEPAPQKMCKGEAAGV